MTHTHRFWPIIILLWAAGSIPAAAQKPLVGSFCISPKQIAFSKCILDPLAVPGQTLIVKNCGNATLSWFTSVTYNPFVANWFSYGPANGALSAGDSVQMSLSVQGNLLPGTYRATLIFTSPNADNSPQRIEITYTVYGEPRMLVAPRTLIFTAPQYAAALPAAQGFDVIDSSRCNLDWSARADSSWLNFALGGHGQFSERVNVWVNTTALPVDTHRTVVRLTSRNASNKSDSVVVLYIVTESVPLPPDSLRVERVSDTELYLVWRDRSNNEDWFEIQRSDSLAVARDTARAAWDSAGYVYQNTSTWLDKGLAPCTKYLYRVRAVNRFGASAWSNVASGTTCREQGVLTERTIYAYPNPLVNDNGTTFSFTVSKASEVTIRIVDAANIVHRTIHVPVTDVVNCMAVKWDGRDEGGGKLPNGVYFYLITSDAGERSVGKLAILR